MSEITPNELKARLDRNDRPLLLDVRQDWETKLCRLENAVHIPIEEIELRTDELNPNDEIVVYCHQGVRSAAGAQSPREQHGLKNVKNLPGRLETVARDTTIRATVLAGRGRAFTAGMDVRVLHGLNATSARALITDLCAAIDAVHRAPFPVLAAVHGACLGAGFELALACDLRLAAADASFGLPEVRVGVPSVIQAALLPPLIGPGRAAEMLLLGT